jgi:putative transposase
VTGSPETAPPDVRLTRPERAGGESHETDRQTPEQVIRKLRDAERMLAEGKELHEVCRALENLPSDLPPMVQAVPGDAPEEVVVLKNLQKENARLKKLVANQAFDIDMLKDVAKGNW